MPPDRYLAELASSLKLLGTLARQPEAMLARAVPACPGWTLEQLFGHLGSIERWAAAVVREGTFVAEPAPPAEGAAAWFLEGTAPFIETMSALDPEKPCWNFGPPPRKAGFWLRRQAHEHAVHLIDASQALGLEIPALGEDFLLDGVDEVLAMFAPRQVRLDRMPHPDKCRELPCARGGEKLDAGRGSGRGIGYRRIARNVPGPLGQIQPGRYRPH